MDKKLSFLVVDDENTVVITLKALIAKSFPGSVIYTANNGKEGWDAVQLYSPRIVISDYNMPEMNGIDLCKKIREDEKYKYIFFLILTAATDKDKRIESLNNGVDDFLNKPFSFDEFQARLNSGVRISKMQIKMEEENTLLMELAHALENEVQEMIRLSVKFLQTRIPSSIEMLKRVAEESVWIAKQLGDISIEMLRDIEIAAFLCHAGRIFLPDSMLKSPVMIDGQATDKLMYQVPVSAKEIISSVSRFKDVANILYNLYENFDGSGFPNRVKSWQIPIGARIIRPVLDFEELRSQTKKNSRDVLSIIDRNANRLYDHRVVTLLNQYLASNKELDASLRERAVHFSELEEGMILSQDIITNSGLKLMGAGAVLNQKTINWILSHNTSDPIIGNIFVKE